MKANWLSSGKERGAYGLWFVGQNIIYILVLQYLAIFFTDEIKIGTGAVAILLLVARIWDAVNDPLLGSLVDKANPKRGKFKPWINAVSIVMPIVTIFVFFNLNGSDGFNLTYAYITYIVWGMTYTISDVPIFALATTMTDVPDERVSIMSIGRLAAGLASMVVGIVAAPIIVALGYTTTVIILMIVSLLVMMPLRFLVKERVEYNRGEGAGIKEMIQAVAKNKYLLIFYSAFILLNITNTAFTVGTYFAKWNLGDLGLNAAIMGTIAPIMILLPIFTPMLIRRFGKRKIFIFGISLSIVTSIIQYFVGYDIFGLFLLLNGIKMFGLLLPMVMMGMFTADCVEYGDWKTGNRKEGVTFSIQTFSTKFGGAISGSLGLLVMTIYGYDVDATVQSASALEGIWVAVTLLPAIGLFLGLLVFVFFYKLSEDDVARMMKETEARRVVLSDSEAA